MKYYTYLHRKADTGEVFYVGKGTGLRAYRTYHRDNPAWHDVVAKHGYKVEIVDRFANNEDARWAETELMELYKDTLVNKQLRSIVADPLKISRYIQGEIDSRIYTKLGDIWVNLTDYNSRLAEDKTTGCLEVVRGALHNQGYMMIGAIRDSDRKRIMTTGARVAGRLKAGRDLSVDEYVVKSCSNPKCHNLEHLIIGDRRDIHAVMKRNGTHKPGPRREVKQNRTYAVDVPDMKWALNHSVDECMNRFGWTRRQTYCRRNKFKTYKWMIHFDDSGKLKPEYDHLYVDIL